jgi:hypothetical protein
MSEQPSVEAGKHGVRRSVRAGEHDVRSEAAGPFVRVRRHRERALSTP